MKIETQLLVLEFFETLNVHLNFANRRWREISATLENDPYHSKEFVSIGSVDHIEILTMKLN